MHQFFLGLLGGFVVNIVRIDEEGVVVVIDIVNAEIEGEQTRIQTLKLRVSKPGFNGKCKLAPKSRR